MRNSFYVNTLTPPYEPPSFVIYLSIVSLIAGCSKPNETALQADSFTVISQSLKQAWLSICKRSPLVWNADVDTVMISSFLHDFRDKGLEVCLSLPCWPDHSLYIRQVVPLCAFALKEAKKRDPDVWIYDENSYPSGFTGGHVPNVMPESYNQG